jgi:hypothetical protein
MADILFLILCAFDFITNAGLLVKAPALMWALFGLVMGGTLALWLEAPLYGLRARRRLIIAVPLLLFFVVGVVVVHNLQPERALAAPPAPPPAPPAAPNFGGTWDTGRWGIITMLQDRNYVFGNYTYANGVIEGNVEPGSGGTSVLRFRWRNQDGGSSGVGYFELNQEATGFAGKYSQGETLTGGGSDWSGTRTAAAPPPPSFTGTWDTEWGRMVLNQGVSQVTGTYEYGGGMIVGDVKEGVLKFRWTNRVTGETGTGQFTLATYGRSFSGTWSSSQRPADSPQTWTGQLR